MGSSQGDEPVSEDIIIQGEAPKKESIHEAEPVIVAGPAIQPKQQQQQQLHQQEAWFDLDDDHNTYVYVTGLPLTMDGDQFVDLMKKCGVIKFRDQRRISVKEQEKNLATNLYNIKMYLDRDGKFKGDALCCYARVESVDLALEILDGYPYDEKHVIHVSRAKFEKKGEYDPSKKPKKVNKKYKEKQKKKIENLLAWRPDKLAAEKKNNLTVVISNMFEVRDFIDDPTQILEYRQDLEEECEERCGKVKKVVIYDQNPDGVATVTFEDMESAEKCVKLMDGRSFAMRKLSAKLWDGKTKYKVQETDEEIAARLQKWHQDLESDATNPQTKQVETTGKCDRPATQSQPVSVPVPVSSRVIVNSDQSSPPAELRPKRLKTFNSRSDDESDGDIDKIQDEEEDDSDNNDEE